MAASWNDLSLSPLPIGGAAMVSVTIDPTTPVDSIRLIISNHAITDPNEVSTTNTVLDIPFPTGSGQMECPLWGAPKVAGLYATFFSVRSGAWSPGPVFLGVDLTPSFKPDFPWDADWVVDRLKDVAETFEPLPGKKVNITRAFPRDTHGWPSINVQVDALTPTSSVIGDVLNTTIGNNQTIYLKGRLYSLQLSVVAWCATPEQRSALGEWLGGATEVVIDAAGALGWEDPTSSFRESEDFESLGTPAFLVTGNISATVLATLQITQRNAYRLGAQPAIPPSTTLAVTLNSTLAQAGEGDITATIAPVPGCLIIWSVVNGYIESGQGTNSINIVTGEGGAPCVVSVTATIPGAYAGTGTASVNILPWPFSYTVTTPALALGARYSATLNLGSKWHIREIITDGPARVRVYQSDAQRTADANRVIGGVPTGDHGILAEAVMTATGLDVVFDPWAYAKTPSNAAYLLIDNTSGQVATINTTINTMMEKE